MKNGNHLFFPTKNKRTTHAQNRATLALNINKVSLAIHIHSSAQREIIK
jgi:hypothetical protein